jgi:hypothetical protein
MRHHNIEPIRRTALENYHQPFVLEAERLRCICGPRQKRRHRSRTNDGKRGVTKENATSDGHSQPPENQHLAISICPQSTLPNSAKISHG